MNPALTAEEWALREGRGAIYRHNRTDVVNWGEMLSVGSSDYDGEERPIGAEYDFKGPDRHALAALALYGQPFGFTSGDVADIIAELDATWEEALHTEIERDKRLRDLADRIAALLPPEGT